MPLPSLHHVGYVVTAPLEEVTEQWRRVLSAVSVSEVVVDPLQKVRAVFLGLAPEGSPQVELLEPAGPDSPVRSLAEKGGGMHHLCFEVDVLEEQIQTMRGLKASLLQSPRPAVAFGGRRIAWMFTREKMLVEYLERAGPQ